MVWPWLLMALALVQQTGPVVRVESGTLEGTIDSATGAQVFRGVPYSAHERWKGVRKADRLGANCIQKKVYDDIDAFAAGMSEHCQFLNVWTTGAPHQAVMFWIHGGGFKAGFGGEARHNGARLATKGVVVVTINYRLGPYGFSDRNYGLLDQIAALQWVQ